jgi:uncharacterized membrane protein YphA (DoxX/SURF4 family)
LTRLTPIENRVSWLAQLIAVVILIQTLYFKFTGAAESRYIFETLGMEPWGRIGSGIVELIASLLLLAAATAATGAVIALGVMAGAIGSHLTRLGIEVQGDGGLLFGMAITVTVCCLVVIWIRRRSLPVVGKRFD